MTTYAVKHQEKNRSFIINLGDQTAYMRYRISEEEPLEEVIASSGDEEVLGHFKKLAANFEEPLSNSVIDFHTTFVPDTHRGQGIASQLVEAGFAWADEQGMLIKASCWYADKKLRRRQAGR